MKKAFSTLACPTLSLEELLSLAERKGMDAVEIRLDCKNRLCEYLPSEMGEAKRILDHSTVGISNLATGISFAGEKSQASLTEQCSQMAAFLGVPALRVFAGNFVDFPVEIPKEKMMATAASLDESAEIAARYGVELWLETHSEYSTGASVAKGLPHLTRPKKPVEKRKKLRISSKPENETVIG